MTKIASTRADFIEPRIRERSCKTLLDVGGSTDVVAHVMKKRFDLLATLIDRVSYAAAAEAAQWIYAEFSARMRFCNRQGKGE